MIRSFVGHAFLAHSKENQLAAIWTAVDADGNKQIEGILYNADEDKWSKSIQISDTDASVYEPRGIFGKDGNLQFFYKKTGEAQTDLCTLMVVPSVNLAIENAYCDESTFVPGDMAKVRMLIKNNGSKSADSYTVDIDGTKTALSECIAPGESVVVEADYKVPEDLCFQKVNIVVEADGDADMADNSFELELGYTDLVMKLLVNKYEFGQLMEVRVANESCVDTAATLEIRKGSRDGELVKSIDLGTVSRESLTTLRYLWNENTENYSADTDTLYFNVVSEKPEKYVDNNYDFAVVGSGSGSEEPPETAAVVSLEAVKGRTEYTVGDTFDTDDLTVTAYYADETSKAVTGFTTDASALDLSTAGKKTLKITFEENGVTVETSIEINVKEAVVPVENCMVTFDANGGTDLSEASRTVEKGKAIGALPSVKRDGYTLKGWYTEKTGGSEVTQATVITEDITLYARWETTGTNPGDPDDPTQPDDPGQPTYTVTFDLRGKGTALPDYTGEAYTNLKKGSTVKEPHAPTADGYVFTGWYKDATCKILWDFSKDTIEADTILYAGWTPMSEYEGVLPGDTLAAGNRDSFWVAVIKDQTYTGRAIKPEVHVYDQERRLEEGRDCTLIYKNNVKVPVISGKKTPCVTVKGTGSYKGTYTVNFTICKATLDESHLVYTAAHPKGKAYIPAVIRDGVLLKAKTDYVLTYENNDTHKVTKKAPTKEGNYTMHVSGRGSCTGDFNVPYEVTAKDASVSITKAKASVASMTYRGAKPTPTLTVKKVGTLKEGTDYTVRYANTDAKGTATAIFTGTGNYSGVLKKTFKVKAAPIADKDVTVAGSAPYQKGGAKPEISVIVDGVKLIMGVDYTASYKNNKKAGKTATVTIKGKGNYSGKVIRKYQVTAAETAASAAEDDALQSVYMEPAAAGL